jgi:hypothetical protein
MERRSPQDVSLVKSYFELLSTGHSEDVEKMLDPTLENTESRSAFQELTATIPRERPRSVKVILVDPHCEEGRCEDGIILEYRYNLERLLFNVVLRKEGGQLSIVGINIRVIPESFMKENEFTLSNKSVAQYSILVLVILIPVFSLWVFGVCVRSRIGKRKLIWAVFILFGIGRLEINWTTGQLGFRLFWIHLLSAGVSAQRFGPWVIAISLPLGAILFLIKYRSQLFHVHPE